MKRRSRAKEHMDPTGKLASPPKRVRDLRAGRPSNRHVVKRQDRTARNISTHTTIGHTALPAIPIDPYRAYDWFRPGATNAYLGFGLRGKRVRGGTFVTI